MAVDISFTLGSGWRMRRSAFAPASFSGVRM